MDNAVLKLKHWKPLLKDKFSYIFENRGLIAQFLLALLFIAVGAWFLRNERHEIAQVKAVLTSSRLLFVMLGMAIMTVYLVLQALMYKLAFASLKDKISFSSAFLLYIKRNFISVFIPAGGVTSLAFFTGEIEKSGISKTKIHFASSIYMFVGIFTVVLVAIPIFIYAIIHGDSQVGELIALGAMAMFISAIYYVYRSVIKKRVVYRLLIRYFPSSEVFMEDLISHTINGRYIIYMILVSLLIDCCCFIMMYVAMKAVNSNPSLLFAMLAYLVTVLSQFVSPFMRGLGAIEVSTSYVLTRFGFTSIEAVAITFMYRFFEFWLPLVLGAFSFLLKVNKLLMRIIPAVLIFVLGIINIVSAITPAIQERLHRLENFLPLDAIAASNYLVFIAGIFMLLSAIFLFKGLRNAWWFAIGLTAVSCIGHLTKAIDYEEALSAFFVMLMLIFSRKEYRIRGNPKLHVVGLKTAVLSIVIVLIYGIIGFYFAEKRLFGIDFTLRESFQYTFQYFFMIGSEDIVPRSHFARYFLVSINLSGLFSISFLFYTLIRPYIFKAAADKEELLKAQMLVEKYGKSSLDYFKTYSDKLIFLPGDLEAFIAYRTASNYAVVLENPVGADIKQLKECIKRFNGYCTDNGLGMIFYRVPEEALSLYAELSMKNLFIGQEGVVDLTTYNLKGDKNKALRNAINKIIGLGYKSTVHIPPIKDGLMQKLKAVSDEWLDSTDRTEITFSQGMFVWNELKTQTILTVENPEEKVVAFLNIIPDFAPGEGTYDLIRKTDDAPGGVLDFLLVELFKYLQSQNYTSVNLGFAPLSGINDPITFQLKSMKFAYEKIRSFSQYKGLRFFKEKYFPAWYNKYLVYNHDYDLLQIPAVLAKVIKPPHE